MTNTNMRKGFTMIELIFVIVIIGILAAVAIPKLAATRSDAEGAKFANNLATCITDLGGAFMKDGNFSKVSDGATDIAVGEANTKSCVSAESSCFAITGNDANGSITVIPVTTGAANTATCIEAYKLAADMNGTHEF